MKYQNRLKVITIIVSTIVALVGFYLTIVEDSIKQKIIGAMLIITSATQIIESFRTERTSKITWTLIVLTYILAAIVLYL